jgi:integrase
LGEYGSDESKAAYEKLVKRVTADRVREEMARSVGTATDITLAELAVRYAVHVEGYYVKAGKPTSQVLLVKRAVKVAREKFGGLEAVEFGPRCLRECRDEFVALGWCRTEVNRAVGLARQMFKWAVSEELIPETVWRALRSVAGLEAGRTTAPDREPVGPVPDDDIKATLDQLGRTVGGMIRLQLATGMRPGEICSMTTADLTMQGETWLYRPRRHKLEHKGKLRTIVIGPRGVAILREFVRFDREAPCFPTRRGTFYVPDTYREIVVRGAARAGVRPWSPNRIRHSAATRLRCQSDLEATRAILGHGDTSTTSVYARDLEMAKNTMAKIG